MANFSFDVVSEYDKAEMNNVYDQTLREISARYDFKGTPAQVEWLKDKNGFKITGAGEWQIESIEEIIRKKLAARAISQKTIDVSGEITESNLKSIKEVSFILGLDQDKAKKITAIVRQDFPKAKTNIQGELVRLTSNSKDELQSIMQVLKAQDFDFPISFTNYR